MREARSADMTSRSQRSFFKEASEMTASKSTTGKFNLSYMVKKPPTGKRSRKDIDNQLTKERPSWNKQ